tara:strand:+ start:246 stop:2150 length:1905 start_codon:yes stop_codon:yes gene_type:complete
MSFNILGDHGLDIDINILKMVRRLENGSLIEKIEQTIPIGISAISSLKIEDNLMRTGMYGAIEINNKSSILDQLGIAAKSSDDLYISITIKDEELQESGLKPHQAKIEFLGLIEKTVTGSANFQDNLIIFQFEEAFVAEMKHTSWDNFFNDSQIDDELSVTQLVEAYYTEVWKKKNKTDGVIVDTSEGMPTNVLPMIANTKIKRPREESFYDVFKRTLSRTNAVSVNSAGFFAIPTSFVSHLPSFRFTNGKNGIRVMKFKPYFSDRHREFIEEVRLEKIQGDSNDFSDVYTEKFTCGPLAQIKGALDPNTNWHNRIEGESITRPDVGTLRKDVWTNYLQTRGAEPEQDIFSDEFDITNPIIKIHLYAEVVENFIRDELALKDAGVNLPLIDPKSQTKKYVYTPADGKYSDDAIITELYNKLKTSFATVNEKISFTCKGAIYRTPGKFIWIERSATSDESLLEKLWYVNSVEHSIIDGKYQTEIIANRMFGDNTVEAFAKSKTETASYIAGVLEDKNLLAVTKRHKKEIVEEFVQELEKQSAPAPVYTPPTDFMSQQSVDELNMTDEAPARPDIDSTDPVVDVREDVTTAIEDKKQLQEDLGLTDEEMAERQKVRQVEAKEFFANKRRLRNLQKK